MSGKRPEPLSDAEVIRLRRMVGLPDEGPPRDTRSEIYAEAARTASLARWAKARESS